MKLRFPELTNQEVTKLRNFVAPLMGVPREPLSISLQRAGAVYLYDELSRYNDKQLEHYFCFLIASKIADNENDHKFNLPTAVLSDEDADYWGKHDFLTIEEFAALLIQRRPEQVNLERVMSDKEPNQTGRRFSENYRLLERAQKMGRLDEYPKPIHLLAWAGSKNLAVPTILKTAIENYAEEDLKPKGDDNQSSADNVVQMPGTSAQDDNSPKFADTKKLESCHKVIAGALINGYGLELGAKRHNEIRELTEDVKSLGLSISIDTTRAIAKDAIALVPRKTRLHLNNPNSVKG